MADSLPTKTQAIEEALRKAFGGLDRPIDVLCYNCYHWQREGICESCAGTGLISIPLTEVYNG